MKFTVRIADGGVFVSETVQASSTEDVLDIVEGEVLAANAAGDYGLDREVLAAGTPLSEIWCGECRRTVVAGE